MITRQVLDNVNRTLQGALYVDVKLARADRFRLSTEFTLAPGITMLLGPSGAGKTTLLDCIAGLVRPDSGRIVSGQAVLFDEDQQINIPTRRRRCGYLFQDLALFPHMSARQNIAYGLHALPKSEQHSRVEAILRAFHVEAVADRRPREISGGERQRVALARALVTEPDFLLLDEPLTALDPATKSAIVEDLRALNSSRKIPILYVTHERSEAYALGERIIILEKGSVIAEGTPHEVLESPRRDTVAQLAGFENVFEAVVESLHESYGTMTCRLLPKESAQSSAPRLPRSNAPEPRVNLEVSLVKTEPGERLRLGIRAGDILVSLERPAGISAQNMVPAEISAIRREGTTMIVEAASTEQHSVRFVVHLTPRAIETLHLRVRDMVWLVIKTHSCHMMRY